MAAKTQEVIALLGVLAAGCATPCSAGASRDPQRLARVLPMSGVRDLATPVCFTSGIGRGTTDGKHISLDRSSSDAELSAQLAHLAVHLRDRLGQGCAAGLDGALRSEAAALEAEAHVRARLKLPPAAAAAAIADYRRRCQPPSDSTAW